MGGYKKTKIVFLGAPGAGKGTTARIVSAETGIPHISTGDLFREQISKKTKLGVLADSYIKDGNFVPDDITLKIVLERLSQPDCKKGYILDGFPRNIAQANEFEKTDFKIDLVLNLNVSEERLIERLSHRLTCKQCPETFNLLTIKPKKERVCDKCGGELYQRVDDRPKVIHYRLKVYYDQTEPLINHYKDKGLIKDVNADRPKKTIVKDVLELMKE